MAKITPGPPSDITRVIGDITHTELITHATAPPEGKP
jgi:hypothetical protein